MFCFVSFCFLNIDLLNIRQLDYLFKVIQQSIMVKLFFSCLLITALERQIRLKACFVF